MMSVKPRVVDSVEAISQIFDHCFAEDFNTRLCAGAEEPLYLPAGMDDAELGYSPSDTHRLFFRHDYVASAFHEVAHWCIAGSERREQKDYGYWYAPDGRDAAQQREFELVEVKPQALEWLLCLAAGRDFRLSIDNLSGEAINVRPFADAVVAQARRYAQTGLPPRAETLCLALREYSGAAMPEHDSFCIEALGFIDLDKKSANSSESRAA